MVASDNKMQTETRNKLTIEDVWSKETKEKVLGEFDSNVKLIESLRIELHDAKNGGSTGLKESGYKLDPNTRVYSGLNDENLDEWIVLITNNLKAAGVPREKQLFVITNYVSGSAFSTLVKYQKDVDESDRSLSGYLKLLMARRNDQARQEEINLQISKIKQGDDFDAFLQKFQKLANESEMREADLIMFFKSALKFKARIELNTKQVTTIDQAYAMASTFEREISKNNGEEKQAGKSNFAKFRNKNWRQNQNQTRNKFQNQGQGQGQRANANMNSYRRNNERRNNNQNQRRFNGGTNNKNNRDKRCYSCNKTGHIAKDCWSKQAKVNSAEVKQDDNEHCNREQAFIMVANESGGLLMTEAIINGIKLNRVVFDIGATMSIISNRIARKYGFKINHSNAMIKVADDRIVKAVGMTDEIQVNVKNISCSLKLVVFEHNEYEVLLGLDFFNKTGVGIYPKQRLLKFPNEHEFVQLNDFGMEDQFILSAVQDLQELEQDDDVIDWSVRNREIKPESQLTSEQLRKFQEVIPLIKANTAFSYDDLKGGCKVGNFKIKLTSDKIVFRYPYKRSEKEKLEMRKVTDQLLKAGIIRLSNSPYSSPFFIAKKKDGSYRPIIDYKQLNAITEKEGWPIPLIDNILFKMKNARFMSICDCKSGYFQVRNAEESKKYTAFSDGDRKLEWNFMPMGLTNAPMVFSRIMNQILGDLEFVVVYIDDICIFSKTAEEHIEHIKIVMKKLNEANIKLNPDKCKWFATKIKLLGHIISKDGIEMDPTKTESIKLRKEPTNAKEVQRFLGLCNYYRKFIKNFAEITSPLYALIRNETVWEWSEQCQAAFNKLKTELTSEPILRQPDLKQIFLLYTDASNDAIGVVLSQRDENNSEYVVAYGSRLFKGYERHMSISEKEMAACIYGVKEFRHYLFGVHFKIITDHLALKYLMSLRDPTGRLARWSIYLSQFDFEIIHRRGAIHCNADCLSRPVLLMETLDGIDHEEATTIIRANDPHEDSALMHYLKYRKFSNGAPRKQINRIKRLASRYEINNNHLYLLKNDKKYLIPERSERSRIIDTMHAASAHFGIDSTYNRLKEKYYWPKMFKDVETFKKLCKVCIRNDKTPVYNHPAISNKITNVFDEISIDFSWGYDATEEGYTGVMLIQEQVSKLTTIFAMKTKTTEEIAKNLIKYICTYGPPKRMLSDNEPGLIAESIDQMKRQMGIEWHKTVAAYSPAHNGQIEKYVDTFSSAMRKLAEKNHKNWTERIPFIELAYKTRIHSSTKLTPYECMFGVKCNYFEDWSEESNELSLQLSQRAIQIKNLAEITRPKVINNIENAQEKQRELTNKRNKKILRTYLQNGTVVFRKNDGIITKQEPRLIGPYTIFDHDEHGNYFLQDQTGQGSQRKYPLEKLKIVEKEILENNIGEIEKILNDRKIENKLEYLVKWKHETETTWVKEEDFQTIDIINDYWNKKTNKENEEKVKRTTTTTNKTTGTNQPKSRGRGRPPKYSIANLMMYVIHCILITTVYAGEKIKFCNNNGNSIIDMDSLCRWKSEQTNTNQINFTQPILLNKLFHEVSGTGYKCKLQRKTMNCSEGILFEKSCLQSDWTPIKIGDQECWNMINSKRCVIEDINLNKRMKCDANGCSYEDELEPKFNWLSTNYLNAYRCIFHSVSILAKTKTAEIFNEGKCKANEFKCEINKEMLVWNQSVIHECPYEIINLKGKFIKKNNYLINYEENVLLEPTIEIKQCDTRLFKTNQGIFLTYESNREKIRKQNLSEVRIDNALINKLLIANIDMNEEEEIKWINLIDIEICTNFFNLLQLYSKINNQYINIKNTRGDTFTLYTEHGLIYAPECIEIKEVIIMKEAHERCFKEIQVEFKFKEETRVGFINKDLIITTGGNQVDCSINSDIVEMIENGEATFYQRVNKAMRTIKKRQFNTINIQPAQPFVQQANFHHPNPILVGYDELKQLSDLIEVKENENHYFVKAIADDLAAGQAEKFINNFITKTENFFMHARNYIFYMIFIILSCILIFVIICVIVRKRLYKIIYKVKKNKNKSNSKKPSTDDEMELDTRRLIETSFETPIERRLKRLM